MWVPNSCFWNHHEATYNDMNVLDSRMANQEGFWMAEG